MSENLDLEQVITDSVNDAVSGTDDSDSYIDDTPDVEAAPEPTQTTDDDGTGQSEPASSGATQVAAPGSQAAPETTQDTQPKDAFGELIGVPQMGVTGRENRIPYSRVKKITEKAVSDAESKIAETVLGRKLGQGEKATDAVKTHLEQIPVLTHKVQDYEGRLTTVGQFENVMANDPEKFLTMLAKLPAYKQFFQFVETAYDTMQKTSGPGSPAQAAGPTQGAVAQAPTSISDDMPQPDEKLPDGSSVYSMDGLKKLVEWTQGKAREQAVADASKQFDVRYKALESQYAPMMKAWQEHQTRQSVIPVIQAQIAEAKTWPMFNELEDEITKVLEQDKTISLEAAYRKVAFPKMIAERTSMRQNIIKELQSTPAATSVSRPGARPLSPNAGPKTLEEVIKEQVDHMKTGGRT